MLLIKTFADIRKIRGHFIHGGRDDATLLLMHHLTMLPCVLNRPVKVRIKFLWELGKLFPLVLLSLKGFKLIECVLVLSLFLLRNDRVDLLCMFNLQLCHSVLQSAALSRLTLIVLSNDAFDFLGGVIGQLVAPLGPLLVLALCCLDYVFASTLVQQVLILIVLKVLNRLVLSNKFLSFLTPLLTSHHAPGN